MRGKSKGKDKGTTSDLLCCARALFVALDAHRDAFKADDDVRLKGTSAALEQAEAKLRAEIGRTQRRAQSDLADVEGSPATSMEDRAQEGLTQAVITASRKQMRCAEAQLAAYQAYITAIRCSSTPMTVEEQRVAAKAHWAWLQACVQTQNAVEEIQQAKSVST